MNIKKYHLSAITALFSLTAMTAMTSCAIHPGKKTVGATEVIHVAEAGLDFKTRIDTGARMTSIHTTAIHIKNASKDKKQNVGKKAVIVVENEKGKQSRISTKIVKVSEVRNAQGVEIRYIVPLTLQLNGQSKVINVNLRDRSPMTYKLLIGRDWLVNDYVVDVSLRP
jgi:hypothetical protein